ncbi:apolipoprotein N-acyltransferase [bacterium]|nr:MAG: apolipoprotein N-acyltransferase [bacterium]
MRLKRFIIYLITGLCLGFAFPPFDQYQLLFIGFTLLLFIVHTSGNYKQLFFRGYFSFLFFELVAVSWLPLSGMQQSADRFLIIGGTIALIIHSAMFVVPLIVYRVIYRNVKFRHSDTIMVFSFPFVWTAFEYIYNLSEFSFPWLHAGNAFTTNLYKIQFAEITGVFGISFWAVTVSVLLYILLRFVSYSEKSVLEDLKSRKAISLIVIIIIVYVLPDIYSVSTEAKNRFTKNTTDRKINVAVIQPNVNPWVKWGAKQIDLVYDYADQIRQASALSKNLDMIILPETATPFYLLDPIYYDKYQVIKNLIDSINIPLLTGTPDRVFYNDSIKPYKDYRVLSGGAKYDVFNSSVLIEPGRDIRSFQKYAKMKLVIASERMPYQEKLSFLKNMISWSVGISSYQIGFDTTVFNLNGKYRFNTAICYESIYPDYIADYFDKGSELGVIITNDGWWGKLPGTYQHNRYAILRAVENRRWFIRCANTGVSCLIDPYGNIYNETSVNEKTLFAGEVGILKEKTFYTVHRDLLARACIYISGILVFAGIGLGFAGRNKT